MSDGRRRRPNAPSGCSRSARSAAASRTSSPTSRSRRSATSRTRACSRRGGRRAATGSSARRTSSGCETILRLQRDEFLPLRVIRQELASPQARQASGAAAARPGLADPEDELDLGELCERAGDRRPSSCASSRSTGCSSRARAAASKRYPERRRRHRRGLRDASPAYGIAAAAPAHLPHGGRPRGRPARAARRARAALAQPRAAPGGPRGPADARRARAGALAAPLLARPAAGRRAADEPSTSRPKIRDVPDFPKPGIVFKDIMPLLADPAALHEAVEQLAEWAEPRKPDLVLGAEARGFILGARARLPARLRLRRRPGKPGKLPWQTGQRHVRARVRRRLARAARRRDLERRSACSSTTTCSRPAGPRKATVDLVEQLGGEVVGVAFVIELDVPERPRAARRLRRLLADPLLSVTFGRPRRRLQSGVDVRRAHDPVHVLVPGAGRGAGARSPSFRRARAAARAPRIRRSIEVEFACACGDEHPGLVVARRPRLGAARARRRRVPRT